MHLFAKVGIMLQGMQPSRKVMQRNELNTFLQWRHSQMCRGLMDFKDRDSISPPFLLNQFASWAPPPPRFCQLGGSLTSDDWHIWIPAEQAQGSLNMLANEKPAPLYPPAHLPRASLGSPEYPVAATVKVCRSHSNDKGVATRGVKAIFAHAQHGSLTSR